VTQTPPPSLGKLLIGKSRDNNEKAKGKI
jgi:hypothetical protein